MVSKTIVGSAYRGFESLPLRQVCPRKMPDARPFRRLAWVLCLLLAGSLLHAQVPEVDRLYEPVPRPPGVRYQVLTSPHFQIIFQRGAEAEAREAAALLEQELPRAEALTGHPKRMQMPVVLNAYNDRSNGFVSPLPFRQEIETAGIQGNTLSARYTSWMQAVAPHELVHATQAHSDAGFGMGRLLRTLSPDLGRSLNMGLSPGLSEGAAVYFESSIQEGAGRLNFSLFQMQFRAAMASKRPWTLAQVLEMSAYTRPWNRHYIGGAHFFAHLARHDGGQFFRKAKALHYRLPLLGSGVELWYGTKKMPHKLGRAFRRQAKEAERQRQAELGPFTEARRVATGAARSHRRPQWLTDSTAVAHVSGYDIRTGFYEVDVFTGQMQPIAYESVTGTAHFSVARGESALLYSRYVRDRHVGSQWIADVFLLDIATGTSDRLTRNQRVFFPVQAAGRTWAIQNEGQFTRWVQVDAHGEVQSLVQPKQGTVVQVVPSPDGQGAAVLLRQNGRQGIYRAVWADSTVPTLEPWLVFNEASVYDVFWHDHALLFTADLGGTANVYAAKGGAVMQLTNVRYGALEPALSPDGATLVFVEYDHERYDLKAMPLDLSAGRPVSASALLAAVPAVPSVLPFTGGEIAPYRALRHLQPRAVLPFLGDSGDGTLWTGSLGMAPGVSVQGVDPLQRWAYSIGAYYQADRMWYAVGVGTHVGGVRADLEVFSEPTPATATEHAAAMAVGRQDRGVRVKLSLPIYVDSNVRSTDGEAVPSGYAGRKSSFCVT